MIKRLVIPCLIVLLALVGCGNTITTSAPTQNTQEVAKPKIPEPYTQMLEKVKGNDLEMAEKYADLTIKDFPDSPYVYNTYLIKNSITLSKIGMNNYINNFLSQGVSKLGSLTSEEDINFLIKVLENLKDEYESYQVTLNETTQYLLSNYSKDTIDGEYKLPAILPPEGMTFIQNSEVHSLDWFASVSYPTPPESDIENAKKLYPKVFYFENFNENGEIGYPSYLYNLSKVIQDNSMKKDLFNKILEITEDDSYNEFRVKAQEDLSKLQ